MLENGVGCNLVSECWFYKIFVIIIIWFEKGRILVFIEILLDKVKLKMFC